MSAHPDALRRKLALMKHADRVALELCHSLDVLRALEDQLDSALLRARVLLQISRIEVVQADIQKDAED